MKSIIITALFAFCFIGTFASNNAKVVDPCLDLLEETNKVDCSFEVKGEMGGVEVDLTITVYDVSVWQCAKLKVAAALN